MKAYSIAFIFLFSISFVSNGQDNKASKAENLIFEIFVGTPYAETFNPKSFTIESQNGVYGIRGEFLFSDLIGFGLEVSYASFELRRNDLYSYTQPVDLKMNYDFSIIRYIPRVDIHLFKTKNLDLSIALGLGTYIITGDDTRVVIGRNNIEELEIPHLGYILDEFYIPASSRLAINGTYYIRDNFGFNMSIGLGTGYIMSGGLVYKLAN